MISNLYKVEVRDQNNNKVLIYLNLTAKVLENQSHKTYILIPKLIATLTYETEEELFNQLPYYLKRLNVDLYYTNPLTSETYYYPIEIKPYRTKELPMSHSYPNRHIENIKQMQWYQKITYKGLEKIIQRKGYLISNKNSQFEKLTYYLKLPQTLSAFSTYYQLLNDKFKAFLLLLRDFYTTYQVDKSQVYYYYNYNNNNLILLGYYSGKQVKETKFLTDWIKKDKGKDLRNNSVLLPIEFNLLKLLWRTFNSQL